jgi:hypothetical protein
MRLALLLACSLAAHTAFAADAECPEADDVGQAQLLGTWKAQVEGGAPLTLELHRHPEFAETVRGSLERDGRKVELAGDVGDGELTLEESANGTNISARWLGDVIEGSCGREIRGTWEAEGTPGERAFVLRKQ